MRRGGADIFQAGSQRYVPKRPGRARCVVHLCLHTACLCSGVCACACMPRIRGRSGSSIVCVHSRFLNQMKLVPRSARGPFRRHSRSQHTNCVQLRCRACCLCKIDVPPPPSGGLARRIRRRRSLEAPHHISRPFRTCLHRSHHCLIRVAATSGDRSCR